MASILVLLVLFLILELTNTTNLINKPTETQAVSSDKNQFSGNVENDNNLNSKPSSQSADKSSNSSQDSSILLAPSGAFVSNHKPNLDGKPAPNTMQSVCNTTPGATCSIIFTKDNISKSLIKKKADSNGNVYWDWSLQEIGLTEGTWTIEAKSSLSGTDKSTFDSLTLDISQ